MKKHYWIVLSLVVIVPFASFAGIFSGYLSEDGVNAAIKAIHEDNLKKLESILGSKNIQSYDISKINEAALSTSESSGYVCHTDIVKFLFSRTKKRWDYSLTAASMSACPEIMQVLIPRSSPTELAEAGMKYNIIDSQNFLQKITDDPMIGSKFSQEKFMQRVHDTGMLLVQENKKYCKPKDPMNQNCAALDHIKSSVLEVKQREKDQQLLDSPEGTAAQACEVMAEIKSSQQTIQEQKNIAKISGIVNRVVLYQAGGEINASRKELAALKTKYHSQTGKSLDLRRCKQ